jgi:2-oxoisovalerate dehydrogenase E2 component (dihydrolipoyl transacylase)
VPKDFVLPELAESVVEGEVVRWMVAEGDRIEADQPLVEVMTDKVTVELPAPFAGVLVRILAPEGAVLAVGAVLAQIDTGEAARPAQGGVADTAGAPSTAARRPPPARGRRRARPVGRGRRAGDGDDDDDRGLFRAASTSGGSPLPKVRRPAPSGPRPSGNGGGATARGPAADPKARGAARRVRSGGGRPGRA